MNFFQNLRSTEPKLFILYLGGKVENCNIEVHDVIFVAGHSDIEIKNKIQRKWIGNPKSLHVDSWFRLHNIDGFEVHITPNKVIQDKNRLFFVNLGYYIHDSFGESHFMTLVVAESRVEAIKKAKSKLLVENQMLHSDNIYDIDECIKLEEVDNYYITLKYVGIAKSNIVINGYQKLS